MTDSPQAHWDARHADADIRQDPLELLAATVSAAPENATALDIAGGTGTDARWLARQGYAVTLADVSPVALERAAELARVDGFELEGITTDLESGPLPERRWDVIHIANFFNRRVLASVHEHLHPGGRVLITIATTTNRERNEHPHPRFLVEPGELASLVASPTDGLDLVRFDEGWRANGRHEAWLVGQARSL